MIDPITTARQKYAQYSQEELAKLPLCKPKKGGDNLRKIASDIGVSKVIQDGVEVSSNTARKEFVLDGINSALQAYRIAQEVKVVEEFPSEIVEESPYQAYEEELDSIAKRYYEGQFSDAENEWQLVGLKEYHKRSLINQMESLPLLLSLASQFRPELEQRIIERTGETEVKPTTLHNWRAQILKRIERLSDSDKAQFPEIGKTFKLFYDCVQATFKAVRRARVEKSNEQLNIRQNNAIDIKVSRLINWAVDRLVNLPEKPSEWREVAVALMVVTGRRQSEIMSSAKFSLTDSDCHLEFSGQLKKHKADVGGAYEIPVLGCCADAVINAITWLEGHGKRALPVDDSYESQQKAAKKAHDLYSRYLSQTAKDVCSRFIDTEADWNLADDKGKTVDRRKCHLFRQIYGQSIIPVFYPHESGMGRKAKQILTEVMGHSDTASSRKHAAESYDSDVFVTDIEAVKLACRR